MTLAGTELGWSRGREVPAEDYDRLGERFNPVKFDAAAWVAMARAAGMRYVVMIAKHMDGYCLWDTKQTAHNIMRSPFGRDAVRGGKTPGVKAARMHLGAPDESGRQAPEETPGSAYDVPGDLVIAALGFDPEDLSGWDLATTRWGTLNVDAESYATNLPGVYAAGDIVRGASLVVWAIKEGRDAADAMHAYIQERANTAKVAAE